MTQQILQIISVFLSSLGDKKKSAFRFLMISGLIGLTLLCVFIYLSFQLSSFAGEYLTSLVPWPWAKESIFLTLVIGIAVLVVFFMLFKYLLLIALSPILSLVSEKAEKQYSGQLAGAGFSMMHSAGRSVRVNMRNMIREAVITVLLLIAGLIPVLNFVALPMVFLVQAYFTGFGIMDYYLERHFDFKGTIKIVYNQKWAAITLGSIFIILFAIPVLGIMIAPYLTTVAATKYFIQKGIPETVIGNDE
ncbi:MAG: EI24 domain-containing protein [Saprospiraceae bacterium]|nr:EI24 domain-containing protein [Saprospiraceae bacterium]